MRKINPTKLIVFSVMGLLILIFGIVALCGFRTVKPGYIGVKTSFGKITDFNLEPGLHYAFPIGGKINKIDLRSKTYTYTGDGATADQLRLPTVSVTIAYNINKGSVPRIMSDVGIDMIGDKYIAPALMMASKTNVAKFTAPELLANRDIVASGIREDIVEILSEHGITITLISIDNIGFTEDYRTSIEAKERAKQDAETQKQQTIILQEQNTQSINKSIADATAKINTAQAEADSVIIKAAAEAEAIRLVQEQIQSAPEDYITYLIANGWDGKLPETLLGDGKNIFFGIN